MAQRVILAGSAAATARVNGGTLQIRGLAPSTSAL